MCRAAHAPSKPYLSPCSRETVSPYASLLAASHQSPFLWPCYLQQKWWMRQDISWSLKACISSNFLSWTISAIQRKIRCRWAPLISCDPLTRTWWMLLSSWFRRCLWKTSPSVQCPILALTTSTNFCRLLPWLSTLQQVQQTRRVPLQIWTVERGRVLQRSKRSWKRLQPVHLQEWGRHQESAKLNLSAPMPSHTRFRTGTCSFGKPQALRPAWTS
mmetsp:Transcript_18828/g.32149  ORF Transcript_18828/g.32149 Transcript_18828/m.32149 type:complete len:216 (-) Transcript_18828:630-1277(-)